MGREETHFYPAASNCNPLVMNEFREDMEDCMKDREVHNDDSMLPTGKGNQTLTGPCSGAAFLADGESFFDGKRKSSCFSLRKNIVAVSSIADEKSRRNSPSSSAQGSNNGVREASGLKKNLGFFGALSFIVGCMIGSGIFASGSAVAMRSGSPGMILCVWSGCGLLVTLSALCYAELGTAIPKSGSELSYLRYAFGNLGGFMYAWVSILVIKPSGQAGICLAFGTYVVEALGSTWLCAMENSNLIKLFAAFAIGRMLVGFYSVGS